MTIKPYLHDPTGEVLLVPEEEANNIPDLQHLSDELSQVAELALTQGLATHVIVNHAFIDNFLKDKFNAFSKLAELSRVIEDCKGIFQNENVVVNEVEVLNLIKTMDNGLAEYTKLVGQLKTMTIDYLGTIAKSKELRVPSVLYYDDVKLLANKYLGTKYE